MRQARTKEGLVNPRQKRAASALHSPLHRLSAPRWLIPVAATPAVRMTLVHVRTSVISPLRVEARASIIVVASVVTLTICGSADTNPKTGSLNIDPLRPSACHAGSCDRAEHAGGDH